MIRLRKDMSKDVSEDTTRNILHEKIQRGFKVYEDDLAHYARCKDKSTRENPHEDYSLTFLESILYRSVIRSKEIKVKNVTKTAIKLGRRTQVKDWQNTTS